MVTFIDLFAGLGGFRIALERCDATCVASSEIDKSALEAYKKNFRELPLGDITQIKSSDLPAHDVLCGGFPCQPFSIAGKQEGLKDTQGRGTLFDEIVRIAKHHHPKVLFLENVRNLVKHDNGKTLSTIIEKLHGIRYKVYHEVLNASDYGVATSRHRVYIVGIRSDLVGDLYKFTFPSPTKEKICLGDYLDTGVTEDHFVERTDFDIDPKKLRAAKQGKELHPIQVGTIGKGRQGERIYHPNGHAVTFSAQGGGPGAKTGCYIMPDDRVRRLTTTEAFRVMGFPKDYIIPSSNAYKLIGNSVAVPVIELIFQSILTVIT